MPSCSRKARKGPLWIRVFDLWLIYLDTFTQTGMLVWRTDTQLRKAPLLAVAAWVAMEWPPEKGDVSRLF